jgi:hypothetical protein
MFDVARAEARQLEGARRGACGHLNFYSLKPNL